MKISKAHWSITVLHHWNFITFTFSQYYSLSSQSIYITDSIKIYQQYFHIMNDCINTIIQKFSFLIWWYHGWITNNLSCMKYHSWDTQHFWPKIKVWNFSWFVVHDGPLFNVSTVEEMHWVMVWMKSVGTCSRSWYIDILIGHTRGRALWIRDIVVDQKGDIEIGVAVDSDFLFWLFCSKGGGRGQVVSQQVYKVESSESELNRWAH